MNVARLTLAVLVPALLACSGLTDTLGGTAKADSVAELGAAVDQLDAALTSVEAAPTVPIERIRSARGRLDAVSDRLDPVVQKVVAGATP